MKMHKNLISNHSLLSPRPKKSTTEDMEKWALNLTNLMYSLVSNAPKNFGIYKKYIREDVEELLAHYETDLCDAAPYLDAEGITRLA